MTTIWKLTSLHQIGTHHMLPNLICPINLKPINHSFHQIKFGGIELCMVVGFGTNHISKKEVKQPILYGHPTPMHYKLTILRLTLFFSFLASIFLYQFISHKDLNNSSLEVSQGPVKEPPKRTPLNGT